MGADGMHSATRSLAFGPEPGRMAALGGSKAPAFVVFASDPLPPARDDVDVQKLQVAAAYAGGGWRLPELMSKLPHAEEFYMDSISRATLDHYSKGRVVLLGDAAHGNALGGFGTGLALVGAYVLAGEIAKADGEHHSAFAHYEAKFRDYASVAQKVNAGRLLRWPGPS